MPLWQPMQLFKNKVLTPPGLRVTSWRMRSGGRVMSMTVCRSLHRWFIMVKRNMRAVRAVHEEGVGRAAGGQTPAVAAAGMPVSADWVLDYQVRLAGRRCCRPGV